MDLRPNIVAMSANSGGTDPQSKAAPSSTQPMSLQSLTTSATGNYDALSSQQHVFFNPNQMAILARGVGAFQSVYPAGVDTHGADLMKWFRVCNKYDFFEIM